MTLRRCTVAPPFGTIKARMCATHLLMRRLSNLRAEMALNALAYNIERMVDLARIRVLMAAIPDRLRGLRLLSRGRHAPPRHICSLSVSRTQFPRSLGRL